MYIPAAPMCAKNRACAQEVAEALALGRSPADFPPENYETGWRDRFTFDDLNANGRRALGLA